jgi:hypothetical protein
MIWKNPSIPIQSIEKSTEEFEQDLLFAYNSTTTGAKWIQNIVERNYHPAKS